MNSNSIASYLPSAGVKVESLPLRGRKLRKPQHNFHVRYEPFQIQPFMIAPVLPGDTMKNLLMQASTVSTPLASSMLGWWNEFYFFYVKLRDLPERTAIEQMLIANAAAPAAGAADVSTYYHGEGVDWARKCLDRVTECYFRSEEELAAAANPVFHGLPLAKLITQPGWMENLKTGADAPVSDGTPLPGDHFPELPEHLAAFSEAYAQWQQMQALELVKPDFTQYLKSFGIKPPAAIREEKHIPELIRYVRNFKKPTNTVGSDGTINSQVVWGDVAERGDKDRFFAEPGFIFGVTTTRAKMYAKNQRANMSSFLNDAYSWLPALLQPDPFTSLKKFSFGGVGPLENQTEDYWVDLADLFVGGDQFHNFGIQTSTLVEADVPLAGAGALPINKDYPSENSLAQLGKAATIPFLETEGRVDLTILSGVVDTTP